MNRQTGGQINRQRCVEIALVDWKDIHSVSNKDVCNRQTYRQGVEEIKRQISVRSSTNTNPAKRHFTQHFFSQVHTFDMALVGFLGISRISFMTW